MTSMNSQRVVKKPMVGSLLLVNRIIEGIDRNKTTNLISRLEVLERKLVNRNRDEVELHHARERIRKLELKIEVLNEFTNNTYRAGVDAFRIYDKAMDYFWQELRKAKADFPKEISDEVETLWKTIDNIKDKKRRHEKRDDL